MLIFFKHHQRDQLIFCFVQCFFHNVVCYVRIQISLFSFQCVFLADQWFMSWLLLCYFFLLISSYHVTKDVPIGTARSLSTIFCLIVSSFYLGKLFLIQVQPFHLEMVLQQMQEVLQESPYPFVFYKVFVSFFYRQCSRYLFLQIASLSFQHIFVSLTDCICSVLRLGHFQLKYTDIFPMHELKPLALILWLLPLLVECGG